MLVGYKLIRESDGSEVKTWGGVWGQCPGIPNPIYLPNGDHVHAPAPGESYGGFKLVEWEMAPPPPTATDVRREAQRRMMALVSARDPAHLELVIANRTREAVRLLRRGSSSWTPEEAARAAALEAIDVAIEQIREASNRLEADPPADFADPKYWP